MYECVCGCAVGVNVCVCVCIAQNSVILLKYLL